MAENAAQNSQRGAGSNAKRYATLGLAAGAIFGLATGGGLFGMLQMAAIVGGVSAVGGAVVGNKVNPYFDKAISMVPFLKDKLQPQQVAPAQAPAPVMQQAPSVSAQVSAENMRAVSEVDAGTLEQARQATNQSMQQAREGMDAAAAEVSAMTARHAGAKPNHPGSQGIQ